MFPWQQKEITIKLNIFLKIMLNELLMQRLNKQVQRVYPFKITTVLASITFSN